jgi:hypothetical protein
MECEKEQDLVVAAEVIPVAAPQSPQGTSSGSSDLELEVGDSEVENEVKEMPKKEKKAEPKKTKPKGNSKKQGSSNTATSEIKKLKAFKKTVLAAIISLNK